MRFRPLEIPDVVLVEPAVFSDRRGFFYESWQERKFTAAGIDARFVQDNHSRSTRGSLRGLHYQVRHPQGKLVRVTRGEVFDVAVDLRRSSARLGRWVGACLSEENKQMLWIPPGFAHGFYVISPEADLLYKCTDFYSPTDERTLRWDDPQVAIAWPLLAGQEPVLSSKDAAGSLLAEAELLP